MALTQQINYLEGVSRPVTGGSGGVGPKRGVSRPITGGTGGTSPR